MELTNEFTVEVPVEEAWAILTDVERIAPCMPGAQLQEVEGDEYRGVVKVKVGPVTAEYRGKATFVERDETAHRAVLRAEGRESRGQGNANATITAVLEAVGGSTKVSVGTDLTITGRVAQFGRGVLADVSNKLLGQFVDSLEATVLSGPAGGAVAEAPGGEAGEPAPVKKAAGRRAGGAGGRAGTRSAGAGAEHAGAGAEHAGAAGPAARPEAAEPAVMDGPLGARRLAEGAEPPPVDLLEVAGPAVLRRALPLVAAVVALVAGWWVFRRLRSR